MQIFAVCHRCRRYVVCFAYCHIVRVHHWCERQSVFEEHLLPLAYVAKIVVVKKDDFYRSLLFHYGAEFLYVHLQTTVTAEYAYRAVWSSECRSYCCWQSVPHRAQSAAGYYAASLFVAEIAASHHLVLTYVGNQYGVVIGSFAYSVYYFAHKQRSVLWMYFRFDDFIQLLFVIFFKTVAPFPMFVLFQQCCYGW